MSLHALLLKFRNNCLFIVFFIITTIHAQVPVKLQGDRPSIGSYPTDLINSGGIAYFFADDGLHGRELWRSDGTDTGTYMIKDIAAGIDGCHPSLLYDHDGTIYFTAQDSGKTSKLWKTDGTKNGTLLIDDVYPGSHATYHNFTSFNGDLYFVATNGLNGSELWKTDGSPYSAVMVKDINTGQNGSSPEFLTVANGRLFFRADDGIHGQENQQWYDRGWN